MAIKTMMRAVLLSLALTQAACAPIWVPIEQKNPRPFTMPTHELKMNLPIGWMSQYYSPVTGLFLFTVHGEELEEITIRRFPKTQIVKGTNRAVTDNMTLQDIANLSLDSRRLDDGVGALEILSNRPAQVGGQACFRLDYRYRNAIGLAKRTVEYGCPVTTWLYRFEFHAPTQHYFDARLGEFETMVESVQFTVPGV